MFGKILKMTEILKDSKYELNLFYFQYFIELNLYSD